MAQRVTLGLDLLRLREVYFVPATYSRLGADAPGDGCYARQGGAGTGAAAAIAIVDADAKLLCYARMDNCRALPQRMAVSKAYTSAMSGADSDAYAQRLKNEGRNIADFGDSSLVAVQGGPWWCGTRLPIWCWGAIGVSGPVGTRRDEDLARLGLEALGL